MVLKPVTNFKLFQIFKLFLINNFQHFSLSKSFVSQKKNKLKVYARQLTIQTSIYYLMMYSGARKAFCKIMQHKEFGRIEMYHCRIEMYQFQELTKSAE